MQSDRSDGRRKNTVNVDELTDEGAQLRGARRPALFLNASWRDGRYEAQANPLVKHNTATEQGKQITKTHKLRSWELSRELPDMPPVAGGMSGFELAESLTCSVITEEVPAKIALERDPERAEQGREDGAGRPEDVLCCNPACGKQARGAVVWYPFDVGEWSGHGPPQMVEEMPDLEFEADSGQHSEMEMSEINQERVTVGIPIMAWCGTSAQCKWVILGFLLSRYGPLADQRDLLGGRTYCWQCGDMNGDRLRVYDRPMGCGVWCEKCDRANVGRRICSQYGVKKE